MKLSKHLCLECSTCAIFFSSSFTVSIMALFLSKKPPSPTADNTLPMHGDKGKTRLPDSCYQSEGDGLHVLYTLLSGNEVPKAHDTYIYNGEKVIS